jgi:hypothetical protein
MTANTDNRNGGAPRWRYLFLAALIFIVTGAILAGLWQLPRIYPQLSGSVTATVPPTSTPKPTSTPFPTQTPTQTPAILHPTITDLNASVDDESSTITFHLEAEVPPDRSIEEVILWYDTEAGHQTQRTAGPLADSITLSYELDAALEGLTRTLTTTQELDYWWLVRDTTGESVREGATAILGPSLQAMVVTPAPEPPPVDFAWSVTESLHFQFYYVPGSSAERDLSQIADLAEDSLERTSDVLDMEFTDQMSIYFVPRIFWQGGAAYGDKVQLISYLDRNYTGVETWSYFTHEGTHALAQDILQPKEEEGGPDGVLVEGLAVWASGGHYRQEPIDAWAAVIGASDEYLPLSELRAGPFYDFQHETSYLEGASFIKYLIELYGLDTLKELYGQATNEVDHDEDLVQRLYGKDYATLEADWLEYLAGLNPTPEQAENWRLKVRSFDLMRRYETELDPDARILPGVTPPEWLSDTLEIFLHRPEEPVNVVLETALIAVQERMYGGDLAGAEALLDDVEAALDAGGSLDRPSLRARLEILELVAAQDRAILRAGAIAYLDTLDPASPLAEETAVEQRLAPPLTAFQQELVRLDIAEDGLSAQGVLLVHGHVADGDFAGDGQLFAVTFVQARSRWLLALREPHSPEELSGIVLPPAPTGTGQ